MAADPQKNLENVRSFLERENLEFEEAEDNKDHKFTVHLGAQEASVSVTSTGSTETAGNNSFLKSLLDELSSAINHGTITEFQRKWLIGLHLRQVPWYGVRRIAAACLIPWLLVGVALGIARLFGLSAPKLDGSLGLVHAVLLVLSLAILALLLLAYEGFFRVVVRKIVDDRPKKGLDRPNHVLLVEGFAETTEERKPEEAAKQVFENLRNALGRLTKTSETDGGKVEFLDPEKKTPGAVIEAIVGERGLDALDRKGLFDRLTHAVDHMQSRIDGEFSAIASRVGWVLASQAFLLSAFVAIVNAERIAPVTQFWLAVGVAFTGSVISFVLSLGSVFGHALIEKLKKARDDLEALLHKHFGIRRCGVPLGAAVHILGHSATRYVPCVTYVAWVTLTLAALSNVLFAEAVPRTVLQGPVRLSQGWVRYHEASPTFRPNAYVYPDVNKGNCPTIVRAKGWISDVVAAWKDRHEAGPNDVLVLVGGADRTRLGSDLQKQIDSNMTLARQRAETVRELLAQATEGEEVLSDRISPERVLITVTGPRIGPPGKKSSGNIKDCSDTELNKDRTVEVWLPGLVPKSKPKPKE